MRSSRRTVLRQAAATGLILGGGSLLAACAASTPAAPASAQKTPASGGAAQQLKVYWHPGHNYEAYKAVWAQAEKDLNVKVNVELFQWPDMRTKLLTGFTSGDVPDLMEGGLWTLEFAKNGYLEPLDGYIAKNGASMGYPTDWISQAPEQNQYEGKWYGIQLHLTANTLFYNPKLLESAGVTKPPTTWAEFLAAAKAVKEKTGVWGYAPEYQVSQAPTAFLWQNDVKWWDPQKRELTLNTPEAVEALQFQVDLVRTHKVAPEPQPTAGYEGPANLFIAKKAAMITTGPWNIQPIRKGAPDLTWDIAPPLKGKVQATYYAGVNLSIAKDSKNKDIAWELMKRLTRVETEAAVTKEAGMLMPRKSWTERPEVAADPIVKKFAGILTSVPLKPIFPYDMIVAEVYEKMFQDAYDNAMYGKMSAKEALDKYVREGTLKLKRP